MPLTAKEKRSISGMISFKVDEPTILGIMMHCRQEDKKGV
jgi:hypothetical protein